MSVLADGHGMSFKQYVFTRKYGFGRGSKESWAFITEARGDADFPEVNSWAELRSYLMGSGMPEEMIGAAKIVWGSYQSRRDRLRKRATGTPLARVATSYGRTYAT